MQNPISSPYKPLTEFHLALDPLEHIYSQQQRTEFKNALTIYTSRADPNQFSKEEATQIFPALFVVGKSYILCTNTFDEGFKWFSHAMIFGEQAEPSIDFVLHYVEMADFFSGQNKSDEGVKCIDKALKILNSAQELDDQKMIMKGHALLTKGFIQREKHDLDGAVETFTQAVVVFEGLSDLEDATQYLIDACELLANLYYDRSNLTQAHIYSIKGLEFMDKALGLDNPRGEDMARKLGFTLLEQKRFQEALVYAEKWGNMMIQEHGKNSPLMAECYLFHGQICTHLSEYADALKKFEQAEKVSKKSNEFDGFEDIFLFKARCHFNLKNYKEAKECLNQAIEFTKKTFGPNTKELVDCYFAGAEIFKGSFTHKDEAKEYYLKALEMYRNLGTACILETVRTIISYGAFLSENLEFREVLKVVPEAMEICQNLLPTQMILLESCHSLIGNAQCYTGNHQEGVANLEAAAKICEDTEDESGKLVLHYYSLALTYSRNNIEKAQEYGNWVLEMEVETNGKGSQLIINTLQLLSRIYSDMNQEQEFKELEAIYK